VIFCAFVALNERKNNRTAAVVRSVDFMLYRFLTQLKYNEINEKANDHIKIPLRNSSVHRRNSRFLVYS